jgi:tetratricopeptide (TPR) repeat protein
MRAVPACVIASIVLGLAPASGVVQAQTTPPADPAVTRAARVRAPSTREALDRYLKGDYEGALQGPPPLTRFVYQDAERWVTAAGAAAVERRSVAAALFALEYAGTRRALFPAVVSWARDLLARQPPRAAEAEWLRASIALAEGTDRWVFLLQGVPTRRAGGRAAGAPVGHIRFARLRYPDDPYFQMAEAVGAELSASRKLDQVSAPPPQSSTGWDRVSADLLDAGTPGMAERAALLERAAGIFERLTSHASLGAEANLRLGYVRLRQGQFDTALAHFDRAGSLTESRSLRFLGHLYSGWVLGRAGRVDEAAAAYRAALRFVPRAQSATSLLVALLAKNDRLADAEAVADEFLAADVSTSDPWRTYFVGDFDAYPDLVRRLRERLR